MIRIKSLNYTVKDTEVVSNMPSNCFQYDAFVEWTSIPDKASTLMFNLSFYK